MFIVLLWEKFPRFHVCVLKCRVHSNNVSGMWISTRAIQWTRMVSLSPLYLESKHTFFVTYNRTTNGLCLDSHECWLLFYQDIESVISELACICICTEHNIGYTVCWMYVQRLWLRLWLPVFQCIVFLVYHVSFQPDQTYQMQHNFQTWHKYISY